MGSSRVPFVISVPTYTNVTHPKRHVEFTIEVAHVEALPLDPLVASSSHRYTDFVKLHDQIQMQLNLPPVFPVPRHWRHPHSVLEKRMKNLEKYLRDAMGASADYSMPAPFREFLKIPPQ